MVKTECTTLGTLHRHSVYCCMQIRISYFQKLVTYEGESTMKVTHISPPSAYQYHMHLMTSALPSTYTHQHPSLDLSCVMCSSRTWPHAVLEHLCTSHLPRRHDAMQLAHVICLVVWPCAGPEVRGGGPHSAGA